MKEEELDLLHRYLDGGISPEELKDLEELLRTDGEARSTLRSLATIDAKWQELETKDLVSQTEEERLIEGTSFRASNWLSLGAIAAALIVGVFVLMSGKPAPAELGIARVIRVEGEALMDGEQTLAKGDELFAAGNVSMKKGFVELAFRESGVHVVAGAPLSMRLDDSMRLFLDEGELKLVVPPQGIGFVVDTADQEIVDLGTSFILKANPNGSEVLVLDGQITVGKRAGNKKRLLMSEGEFATFDRGGKIRKRANSDVRARSLPEVSFRVTNPGPASLRGKIMSQTGQSLLPLRGRERDVIGGQFVPLIQSGFQDQSGIESLTTGEPLRFAGIAGGFASVPEQAALKRDTTELGWMAWYRGRVVPPRKGRFRFWGYADNHLVVAMDGKPVFEGSRDSPFSEIGIPRTDNPALPCLIAPAGFANGPWIESTGDSLQLDILFGEIGGVLTSGLLLIEWEGDVYEETFWGQPRWPVFMTEAPNAAEVAGLESLRRHLEEKMMGSFSIAPDAIWKVVNQKVASR